MAGKTEAIRIRRGLSLYKQPLGRGRGSPNWYVRVHMPIGGRIVHAKSTRTTDVREARRRAEDYWADCHIKRRLGETGQAMSVDLKSAGETRFDRVGDSWLERKATESGTDERRLRALKDAKHAYFGKGGFAAFFGKEDVRAITTDRIRQYLLFQEAQSSKASLASSTKKRTLAILRELLKHAFERQLIDRIPAMPKISLIDNPRPYFTYQEYRRLRVGAWLLARGAREKGDRQAFDRWMEVADFLIFMVSTFLRPSEWAAIQNQHVSIHEGQNPHLKVAVTRGKTRKRTALSMPEAIGVYRRLSRRLGAGPASYLFQPHQRSRQTAKERMADSFNVLLQRTGLAQDPLGRSRTIYSLRHSSLMFRMLYGDNVDLLTLAKNAGTSVGQLERFYLSHLDAEMKLDNLQSLRPGARRA